MADTILNADKRSERGSGPAGRLRREGKVPAVVYGLETDTVAVSVPARELAHILAGEAGGNTLITLQVDGEQILTLARQIQRNPVRGDLEHVDFIRIRRDTAVSADVPVHLVGEAPGVREGGMIEQQLFTITVEAKPADIPNAVEIDVSQLDIGDTARVGDLRLPPGVTTAVDREEAVVAVTVPRGAAAAPLPEEEAAAAAAAEEAGQGAEAAGGGPEGGGEGGE